MIIEFRLWIKILVIIVGVNTTRIVPAKLVNIGLFHRQFSIFEEVIRRLSLIGDTDIVPKNVRKLASHCGGVPPTPSLPPFPYTAWVADPGNSVYGTIVRRLLASRAAQGAAWSAE